MSDIKQFDDFLKKSFSNYSPEVPPHIWENIAAEKKKKRPGIFWLNEKKALLLIAGLLLVGAGIYVALDQKNNSQNIAHEKNGSRQGTGNTAPAAVLDDKSKTATSSENERSAENKETTVAKTDIRTVQDIQPATNAPSKNTGIDNVSKPSAAVKEKKDDAVSIKGKTNKSPGKPVKRASQVSTDHNLPGSGMDGDAGNDDSDAGTAAEEFILPYLYGGRNEILLVKENNLPKQTIQALPVINMPREDCPGAAGNKYYIEAYLSPDYVLKKYNDTGNSTLVERRKQSLSIQSAFSAGLRYTRVFANGMSIRTGFNYSQVNEKFAYAQDNVVQIIYVINNAGDTTDSYYVRGTRYKNSYNHYRTIDVPLVIGYEMGNGNFHANINAGAVINIYSWQKGETLDNNGAPVSITTGKDDNPYQYKTNVGVGFTAAASLYYKLNDRFHVLAEPYFRYNFSPMNKEVLSIQEKFTTIGLRLGIRMDIK